MFLLIGVFIFVAVIFIHELGHFIIGKFYGVKFATFSVGMGPRIWRREIRGTVYCISLLPIGGYVRSNAHNTIDIEPGGIFEKAVAFLAPISPEETRLLKEFQVEECKLEERSAPGFIAYLLGGCFFNLLSLFIVTFFWLLWFKPFLYYESPRPVLKEVKVASPLYRSGFRTGDIIVRVNDKKTGGWPAILGRLYRSKTAENRFTIQRQAGNGVELLGITRPKDLEPLSFTWQEHLSYYERLFSLEAKKYHLSIKEAASGALTIVGEVLMEGAKNLMGLGSRTKATSKTSGPATASPDLHELGVDYFSSPVTMITAFGFVASISVDNLYFVFVGLTFAALFINLIPFPGTDGFQLTAGTIEKESVFRLVEDPGSIPKNLFKNRIVFLGTHFFLGKDIKGRDIYDIPGGRKMSGVEIHATSLGNIQDGNWIRSIPYLYQAFYLLFIPSALGLLILNLSLRYSLIVFVGASLALFRVSYYIFLKNYFIPVLIVQGFLIGFFLIKLALFSEKAFRYYKRRKDI